MGMDYGGMEDCGMVMNRVNGGRRKVNSALYRISQLVAANYYICNAIRRRMSHLDNGRTFKYAVTNYIQYRDRLKSVHRVW